jgi:hypothetical protein
MRSNRTFCTFRAAATAAIALIAVAAPLQGARAQSLPSAKSLLERHDAAVGGRAALDKHSSMHETVTLSIAAANISGTMEEFHAKPNLYLIKQSFGGNDLTSGFDGKTAWAIAPGAGPQVLDSSATAALKVQADFFSDYYDPSKIKSAETLEITDFDGKRCYKVKIVHFDGTDRLVYFDSATGFRAGQTETATMNGQQMERTLVMSDYKDFGGVMIPVKRAIKLPMAEVVGEITAVEFDKVEPSAFALPPEIKAMVKP